MNDNSWSVEKTGSGIPRWIELQRGGESVMRLVFGNCAKLYTTGSFRLRNQHGEIVKVESAQALAFA
jgi:hypothetical protein